MPPSSARWGSIYIHYIRYRQQQRFKFTTILGGLCQGLRGWVDPDGHNIIEWSLNLGEACT